MLKIKLKGEIFMNRKELLQLASQQQEKQENDKLYYRPGLDNVSRLFLHSIKENLHHQRRRKQFEEYSGCESRY